MCMYVLYIPGREEVKGRECREEVVKSKGEVWSKVEGEMRVYRSKKEVELERGDIST